MARDGSWITADGGAMDRVAVLCAVLLGVCAAVMLVVAALRGAWVGAVLWVVVLSGSASVFLAARRRVRSLDDDPRA